MCSPDVSPSSAFLIGLVCLAAFGNFARTSADFSGGEALMLSCVGRELLLEGSGAELGWLCGE